MDFRRLPPALQYRISLDQGESKPAYHFKKEGKGFSGVNRRQGLQAAVDGSGLRVVSGAHRWRVSLASLGRGDARRSPGRFRRTRRVGNRLEYRGAGLTQWYVNGPWGLQQGWTVSRAPAGDRSLPLTLTLLQSGDLRARPLAGGRRAVGLHDPAGNLRLTYGGLYARDATGRELKAWFEIDNDRLLVKAADQGARYPLVIDPWVQTARLTASRSRQGDALGASAALSADGAIAVVGAPGELFEGRGAVYVYQRPAGGWSDAVQTAKLTLRSGRFGDNLGESVAISADGALAAAGAPGTGFQSGAAVYLFQRPAGGWANAFETAKLTVRSAGWGDNPGFSTAISADGAIVATGSVLTAMGSGAVYVYQRPYQGWSDAFETAVLTASDADLYDGLGWSVALSADGSILAAGSVFASEGAGAVYVYQRPSGGWSDAVETAKLTIASPAGDDGLGQSVALSSEGGVLAAGALGKSVCQDAVYMYQRPSGGWSDAVETARLSIAKPSLGDGLGQSVALSSDGSILAAGAVNESEDRGAVYVYQRPSGGWSSSAANTRLTISDSSKGDFLGSAAALSSDGRILAVGAGGWPGGQVRGAVYIFGGVLSVSTVEPYNITYHSAVSGGNVTEQGSSPVTSRGVCWSTSSQPEVNDSKTEDGKGGGAFTSYITGLKPDTAYYVRAYASNRSGTAYGREYAFKTPPAYPPKVSGREPYDITDVSAVSGGVVIDQGSAPVTARGVCWSRDSLPDVNDSKTDDGGGGGGGGGGGLGLTPSTVNRARAYDVKSFGAADGAGYTFRTELFAPTHPPR